jgi:putative NADPH-quinone reductase
MAKIAIVIGNPQTASYSEALGRAYLRGAESGGHQAKLFVLSGMKFDAILREGYRRAQEIEPDLAVARDAFLACDHVVLVFPLWMGDMPALMKGFLERVLQPDLLSIQAADSRASWKIFKDKSARIIMTMGMPGWFYRWYFGAHVIKLLKRSILKPIGIRPVHTTLYGSIEAVGDDKRKQWLREVEALGRQAN